MAQRSLDLIDAMYAAAEKAQPITGRGIGYKLFTTGLIPSMETGEMQRVYRLLKEAREAGFIPWEWIVDETRSLERVSTWDDPEQYARCVAQSYRRDFWNQQPLRVQVWSEKGTVRGVLRPVLDQYAIGFSVMHGFSSATAVQTPLKMTMVVKWSRSTLAISTRAACSCRRWTCRSGSPAMTATTLRSGVSR
jgi:hypothetical protein